MSNYIQLKKQIETLQKQAETLRKRERTKAIADIKEAITAFELSAEDLGLSSPFLNRRGQKLGSKSVGTEVAGPKQPGNSVKKVTEKTSKHSRKARRKTARKSADFDKRSIVAPKYRDAVTGATWTGRGKQPKWLETAIRSGKKLEDFRI